MPKWGVGHVSFEALARPRMIHGGGKGAERQPDPPTQPPTSEIFSSGKR